MGTNTTPCVNEKKKHVTSSGEQRRWKPCSIFLSLDLRKAKYLACIFGTKKVWVDKTGVGSTVIATILSKLTGFIFDQKML